ncbi:helix-turn-helix transcriptional regulator [Thalassococcus lentus]|uniref:Helix-turn-helix domain-containing protein n=1 Tax=Thalassococcus lentus TaxID=1210524 RepID=A0ABT4XUC3_9RHOB|nr:helix-turn-helix domain-containing protein [Thalassococcus lentus]MDA7425571.1 helix-turn-helix domain-containing protein [Thalassococcus lentus]
MTILKNQHYPHAIPSEPSGKQERTRRELERPDIGVDLLLKVDEVAGWLQISVPTLWGWIAKGTFPSPIKLGRTSRWRKSTVESWLLDAQSHAGSEK